MRRELHAGWLAMSLLLGSTAATTSVRGEERVKPVPSAESERDRAVRDFEEGRKAQVAGRLEEAEFFYLRAWRRMKSYDIATNLGQVQLQLQKPASAARYLAFGVRTVGPEIEPERLSRMEALLVEAKAQVGTVRVRVKNVPDAEVFVDGERVPDEEAKHEIYLEPGMHVLAIRRAGYEEEVLHVIAAPLITETVERELRPKAEKTEATGKGAGAAAPGAAASAAAMGEVTTKAPAAGARAEEPRSWVPALALGAASMVALGVAGGFTVAANKASAEGDRQHAMLREAGGGCVGVPSEYSYLCSGLRDSASRHETRTRAATVAYVASGALAIGAVTYALWPRARTATSRGMRASPELSPGRAGIVVRGAW
ncbi:MULTISPECIES: hypothetical protein [Sorangium]|uniref:hypothetical protein n=1 Tax=Sorangium TaxID=39643 RepID=UPI00101A8979|nr:MULTISPECIES: hypothetical protein [Sorangium]